ncbi:hypothetical protein Psuf_038270 [Phytohabitans suffuscus]|uniref:Uncharacterized protein n=1 Tax=Phytohabitans suffuscus TaxID=624315 RepID=A0A6F8YK60_9ACTN|nr:hypothetical protein [Phytohabitans suffuscus]BCB86514.1 hypothetical protein Psuf_038270 [Phytohabitans suffuscus]
MERGGEVRLLRWWAALLLAVLSVPLIPAAPAAAEAPAETGKYYIVGSPVDGQREYLYSIAVRTLGNGNRFREIIELNRGGSSPTVRPSPTASSWRPAGFSCCRATPTVRAPAPVRCRLSVGSLRGHSRAPRRRDLRRAQRRRDLRRALR